MLELIFSLKPKKSGKHDENGQFPGGGFNLIANH